MMMMKFLIGWIFENHPRSRQSLILVLLRYLQNDWFSERDAAAACDGDGKEKWF
jgi:hypothetical protein